MMTENTVIAELPQLDDDERDDAAFRARDRAWAALVNLFDEYSRSQGLTYEALGKRVKRSKSQVQRWLSSPFGMNIKSLGLLAEGLDADLIIEVTPRQASSPRANHKHPRIIVRELRPRLNVGTTAPNMASPTFAHRTSELTASSSGSASRVEMCEHA